MLDLKFVRENPQLVEEAMRNKGEEADLEEFLRLDEKRRSLLAKVEALKNKRNTVSRQIGELKRKGQDAQELLAQMKEVAEEIRLMDGAVRELEDKMQAILYYFPNIPDEDVPLGKDENDNVQVRSFGRPPEFSFTPKAHWELGESLGILDFPAAGKITGTRFALYRGAGARLERALINFMLDLHIKEHGYTEIFPPFLVHRHSMIDLES